MTSNENGDVVSREPIDEHLLGEFYTNSVVSERVDDNGERVFLV